ncbi:MAG: hypothetical protein Q8P21_02085 [bacterium]|nr:hypothetical protein [bacterium]
MVASISRRIAALKKLAKEYFLLEKRAPIIKHEELLRVFDIRGSIHKDDHPHKGVRVYISRKSLKHFVESRKEDLERKHTEEEALGNICFAIQEIQEVITNFTVYELEPPGKHFYVKDYSHMGKPFIRILLEPKSARLEIKSIHFTKSKKKK